MIRRLQLSRRERLILALIVGAGVALRLTVVLLTQDAELVGDQPEYHATGKLFTEGHPFWGLAPYGEPHASTWKAPGYGLWVGIVYTVLGVDPVRVELAQALLGSVAIVLTFFLGRKLFGTAVGLAAAAVVAVYPLAWQFEATLYPEALAVPMTLVVLLLVLGEKPTRGRAVAVGAATAAVMLVRPTSFFLFAGVAAAWVVAAGRRRGLAMTAVSVGVAALLILPWSIRNTIVADGFVPISVQDAAAFGTFNDISASHPVYPYAWRPVTPEALAILRQRPPPTQSQLRRQLQELANEWVGRHPDALPKAFFWNGLSRYWDVRRPGRPLDEAPLEGRDETVTAIGLVMYYLLLPLALLGLWRARRRRELVIPVLALALAASVVFTIASGTRYRAPFEPLIAILACSALAGPVGGAAARLGVEGRRPPEASA